MVITLLPLVIFLEGGLLFRRGSNEEDPSGNDNVKRKFYDYM